jgi:hypothetical protein
MALRVATAATAVGLNVGEAVQPPERRYAHRTGARVRRALRASMALNVRAFRCPLVVSTQGVGDLSFRIE